MSNVLTEKISDTSRVIRLTLTMCGNDRRVFAGLLVFSIVLSVGEGLTLSAILPVANQLVGDADASSSPFIAAIIRWYDSLGYREIVGVFLIVGSKLFVSCLYYVYYSMVSSYMKRILHSYRVTMLANLMEFRMSYFNSAHFGDFIQLISSEISRTRTAVSHVLESARNLFVALVYAAILFLISPSLSAILVVVGVFMFLLDYYVIRETTILARRALGSRMHLTSLLHEQLSGIREIKLFNLRLPFLEKLTYVSDEGAELERKSQVLALLQGPLFQLLGFVVIGAIFGAYVLNLFNIAAIGVPGLLVFMVVTHQLAASLTMFYNHWMTVNDLVVGIPKLNEFYFPDRSLHESSGTLKPNPLFSEISFQNVSLNYPNRPEVLKEISFNIRRGQRIAFVGESGSGKTSILGLLLRLFDPTSGRILFDGVDLRELDLEYLRSRIGVVPQDIYLFNASLEENIRLGKRDAPEALIEECASRAFAADFINRMPSGYKTVVGERGVQLSGGQKQRIAIAQVFLKDPDIIVFDEATSSVDAESEYIIQREIQQIGPQKTVVMVAHRLSTVKNADVIFVVKHGRIVESGQWSQLVSRQGYFTQMIDAQTLASG